MSNLIYIMNGPNLNLLGQREPEIYGNETLEDLAAKCNKVAGLSVKCLQSNLEGQLVDWIHDARKEAAGIMLAHWKFGLPRPVPSSANGKLGSLGSLNFGDFMACQSLGCG